MTTSDHSSARSTRPSRRRTVVCILSRKKSLYSTRRLVEAARAQGLRPIVLDTLRCNLVLQQHRPWLYYVNRAVPPLDAVIPRIGASITSYGLAVVRQLELMGAVVLNRASAISDSRDKLRSLQLLMENGLPVPRTLFAHRRMSVPVLLEQVGGLPVIVKLLRGTQGIGVMLASSAEELQTLLNTFWDLGHEVLVQQFVAESQGRDLRALVVGNRVIAAMRRQAKEGEFRSNIHRGAEGKPVTLPEEYAQAAIRATRAVGLEVAGVDLLESKKGPVLLEVNSSPGFEGIERATGLDVAGAIVRRTAELVAH